MPEDLAAAVSLAPTLSVAGLGSQRGGRALFKGLDLSLRPGQLVWLRGRNGCGKTSLLRLLAGLSTPTRGAVFCDGTPLARCPTDWRRRLLYVAHANALKDDLSVLEALQFLGALQGRAPAAGEIRRALDLLGVGHMHQSPVRTLSQGQRRRCALARLALPQPASVWLLDEPFDALDGEGVSALHALLSRHVRGGGSALLTSHQHVSLRDPVPQPVNLDDFAIAA